MLQLMACALLLFSVSVASANTIINGVGRSFLIVALKFALIAGFALSGLDACITKDALTYLSKTRMYLEHDIGVVDLISNFESVYNSSGKTFHVLYPLLLSEYFGLLRVSPHSVWVALFNTALGFLSATVFVVALRANNVLRTNSAYALFYCALVFTPEVVYWQLAGGKESLVVFLMSLLFFGVSCVQLKKITCATVVILFALTSLLFVRFYWIVIFFVALGLAFTSTDWASRLWKKTTNYAIVTSLVLMIGILIFLMGLNVFSFNKIYALFEGVSAGSLLYGAVRYFLTPNPMNLSQGYDGLIISQMVYLLLLPAFLFGCVRLVSSNRELSVMYLVFGICTCALFYGAIIELQGPRHRTQLIYSITLFQFVGVYEICRRLKCWFGRPLSQNGYRPRG